MNEDFAKFILDNNIKSPLYEIGLDLENDVLNTHLIKENDGLYYKTGSDLMNTYLASDSLKKLSNIVFHIKHVINCILAEYLSKASENGVNVILSTHSDYVVEEFEKHSKDLNAYCL